MELAHFDWTLYWFMFPVALCVATTATFSGIAGSALFAPIFLVVFPFLGPEYQFPGVAAAIGVALLTATFGLSSGVVAYLRRRLIDFRQTQPTGRTVWLTHEGQQLLGAMLGATRSAPQDTQL